MRQTFGFIESGLMRGVYLEKYHTRTFYQISIVNFVLFYLDIKNAKHQ